MSIILATSVGGLLVVWDLVKLWVRSESSGGPATVEPRVPSWQWLVLFGILVVAAGLRLNGLERRSMTHVEVYVPGIQLPPDISTPPPRTNVRDLVLFHWHGEPHPQAYYFLMYGWTRVFGTGLFALRLPSVVFGVIGVALLFALTRRLFDPLTGLVAAGLLAVNGHHVYWSQYARMYAMLAALGLLSSVLLIDLLRNREHSSRREMAYIVVTTLALFTQLLAWFLVLGQMIVVLLFGRTPSGRYPRLLQSQAVVMMLGTPVIAHALMLSRPSDFLNTPTPEFLRNALGFGFLFEPDTFSLPERSEPVVAVTTAFMFAIFYLVVALREWRARGRSITVPAAEGHVGRIAVGMALIMLALAMLSWTRQTWVALTALWPFLVWLGLVLLSNSWPAIQRVGGRLARGMGQSVVIALALSLLPLAAVSLLSLVKPIMTSRALLLFTPLLLSLLAAGLVAAVRRWTVALVPGAAVAAIHVTSLGYFRAIPTPNDYRGIAHQIREEFQPSDVVMVPPPNWITTPLFYDLYRFAPLIVADSLEARMRNRPPARVWVPLFSGQALTEEMTRALRGHRLEKTMTARRGRVMLYLPISPGTNP